MPRVAYVTSDWHRTEDGDWALGGAGWYRCGLPGRELARRGDWEVAVVGQVGVDERRRLRAVSFDRRVLPPADVVVLQRWMRDDAVAVVEAAREAGQVVVNDLDDHFDGLDRRNRAFVTTDPRLDPRSNRDHYRRVLAAGDAILCSTPFLAERYERYAPTVVVRNAVDVAAFDLAARQNAQRARALELFDDRRRLGWVGGTPWRSGDLETLRGLAGPWLRRAGWGFYHGGHRDGFDAAAELAGLDEETDVELAPLVPIEDYPGLLAGRFDVGLVPLNDVPFNRAKSAVKGLEYAAAGLAFVAQDLPEYVELERAGVGATAQRPADWLRALGELAGDERRREVARTNREAVAQFDVRERWEAWDRALRALLG